MSLEEYEPNREFVGRNFNAGEIVQLVLKSRSGRWLPFEYVQMVMMHEAFWAVRNHYADQMRGLWQRGYSGDGIWGRGAQLGTGQFQNNVALPGEPLPEHLCGGTYRSRGRKRKIKPKLSYKEQKERRILKKFGANGVALGADEEAKVKLEGGKRTQAKPRVAGSARGRELRAAAALARFDQAKKEPEDDIKFEVKDEDDSGESERPADVKNEDAVDIDGKPIIDGKGRGMIKVCEDEDPEDQDAQNELQELRNSVQQWRQTHLNVKREDDSAETTVSQIRARQPAQDEESISQTPSQTAPPRIKIKKEEEDLDQEAPIPNIASAAPVIKREADDAPRLLAPRGRVPPNGWNDTVNHGVNSNSTGVDWGEVLCGVCSFANPALAITCAVCSHVLDPASVPNAWRCRSTACQGSEYLNPGDFGVCGVCGQGKKQGRT
ncbi:LOW QUALITY PROTEIN: WLM domain-containing protein [Colletotrichum tofieldiae]|nr:LOW QUALITY PROTEIN: WLM domain-containing protein [Colletotrichum tofieldiae]